MRARSAPLGLPAPLALCASMSLALLAAACGGSSLAHASTEVPSLPRPSHLAKPFGMLTCKDIPAEHVRFCPGGFVDGKDLRVRSFDGVPLSADVTLPASGNGPWPLIVMLHGLGLTKAEFEGPGALQNEAFARRGYAVLTYTARGFGNSCGNSQSRTSGCSRGWIRLADQRYEVRDTQYLAGMLVDEGIAKPAIAVTGVSYGAGQALELAFLDNRVLRRDGKLVPWTSPHLHIPMRVAATFAEWAWSDLATALVPNGSTSTSAFVTPSEATEPFGVEKQSWVDALYLVTKSGYLSPPGSNPNSDLTSWYQVVSAGQPYPKSVTGILYQLWHFKSALGIPLPKSGIGAIMIQNGFTDTLFPASQAIQVAERLDAAHSKSPLLLLLDDVGHGWAQDKQADLDRIDATASTFLDDVMLHHKRPPTGVIATTQTCPKSAPPGGPFEAPTFADLAHGSVVFHGAAPQEVTSSGGNPATSTALNPVSEPLCNPLPYPSSPTPGTATYVLPVGKRSITAIGSLHVSATVRVNGDYPELVARLWDVSPTGTRQIVELGVDSLAGTSSAPSTRGVVAGPRTEHVSFDLWPNAYTFAPGHRMELELVGSNAPFLRKSNGSFTIEVSNLTATLPVH
jgi:alpha-beta hydrolase superfamily lysophospholipase